MWPATPGVLRVAAVTGSGFQIRGLGHQVDTTPMSVYVRGLTLVTTRVSG